MQNTCRFTEKFLQIVWNDRLLDEQDLTCTDGSKLQVISGGVWNVGAGPDFRNAAIVIGGVLYHGDVEVHRFSSDWLKHGHQRDPNYRNVVLHVVWQDDFPELASSESLMTLELNERLHRGCKKILDRVEEAVYPYSRQVPPGACSIRWALTDDTQVARILEEAGMNRLRRKGEKILAACQARDGNQVVYEQLFDSLGFMNARVQFRQLAAACPLKELAQLSSDAMREAILFGTAGMLPDPTVIRVLPDMAPLVRDYWNTWWMSGRKTAEINWPAACGRPYNSIHRRIQTGIEILKWMHFAPVGWLDAVLENTCHNADCLKTAFDDFRNNAFRNFLWENARDFCHHASPPASLLGHCRKIDILLNIFLPYCMAKAETDSASTDSVRRAVKDYWLHLPLAQENRVQKEAVHRFLMPPSRFRDIVHHAAQQQGILDIYKTFCLSLNHDCSQCPFEWKS